MESENNRSDRSNGSENSSDSHKYTVSEGYGSAAFQTNQQDKQTMGESTAVKKRRFAPFALFQKVRPVGDNGSRTPNKVIKAIKRFWYVVVILIVIVAGLVVWKVREDTVNATWSKATDHYGRAEYGQAAELLKNYEAPKNNEQRLQVYAQTMLATRQLDKALPAYESLYASKKDPAVKIVIGNIYNEQKKYDEAAKTYQELITANPSYVQAYVNLATLRKLENKPEEAIKVSKQGVEANPNSTVLHELLISMLLEDKDSEDFKNAVEKLKKLNPKDPILEAIKE